MGTAFQSPTDGAAFGAIRPKPRPAYGTDGMGPIEAENYKALKASPKGWTDAEVRYLATNPSGRLAPDPDK